MHFTTRNTTLKTNSTKEYSLISMYCVIHQLFIAKLAAISKEWSTSPLYTYDGDKVHVWRHRLPPLMNMTTTTMTRCQADRMVVNMGIYDVVDKRCDTIDHYEANHPFATFAYFDAVDLSVKAYSNYRYGFQGQEKDDEIKGHGNSINYTYRMHDTRLGRFFCVDPLVSYFPWNSPYAFSENKVIDHVELEGLEASPAAIVTEMAALYMATAATVEVIKHQQGDVSWTWGSGSSNEISHRESEWEKAKQKSLNKSWEIYLWKKGIEQFTENNFNNELDPEKNQDKFFKLLANSIKSLTVSQKITVVTVTTILTLAIDTKPYLEANVKYLEMELEKERKILEDIKTVEGVYKSEEAKNWAITQQEGKINYLKIHLKQESDALKLVKAVIEGINEATETSTKSETIE